MTKIPNIIKRPKQPKESFFNRFIMPVLYELGMGILLIVGVILFLVVSLGVIYWMFLA